VASLPLHYYYNYKYHDYSFYNYYHNTPGISVDLFPFSFQATACTAMMSAMLALSLLLHLAEPGIFIVDKRKGKMY